MSGTQHEDQQTFIFDFTYQAEISDAIFPELSETLPLQGSPYAAGFPDQKRVRRGISELAWHAERRVSLRLELL